MFYVSNISGALIPYDPAYTSISTATQLGSLVSPVPAATAFSKVLTAEIVAIPVAATLSEEVLTTNVTPRPDDAAVFEGHVASSFGDLNGINDGTNIGRAGALMAYQIQSSEASVESVDHQEVSSIFSIDAKPDVGQEPEKSAYRVNPIKNHRRPQQKKHMAVVAADIMSFPVFTLTSDTLLTEVQVAFDKHKFRHIPIFSQMNKLVGIISDRDFFGRRSKSNAIVARDLMVTNILTARPEAKIRDIAEVMMSQKIGCLPILDEVGTLIGIVTRGDILSAIVNHAPIELWT